MSIKTWFESSCISFFLLAGSQFLLQNPPTTMKLRLRSLETKETQRIEIPNPSSLPRLKELISQSLPSLSPPSSIHLSLNRTTELVSSSPDESIQSLGVTSGDLIYFTTNPNGFSRNPQTLTPNSKEEGTRISQSVNLQLDTQEGKTLGLDTKKEETLNLDTQVGETLELDTLKGEISNSDTHVGKTLELEAQRGETSDMIEDNPEPMEIDSVGKSFSVPGFLRRVFFEELAADGGRNHKLLVIAIHAVLLESGLVGFDPSSKTTGYRFHIPGEWPSGSLRMSLCYTLPEIISHVGDDIGKIHYAILKLNNIGKFFDVYGSLPNGTGAHWVRVDEDRLVPFLNVVWANCGSIDETLVEDGYSGTSPEREVFEFWRRVKDRLALPLLIDLCEKASLELPPCFMRLPTDLKLKILESLPGIDIAKVGSLCSELRYLTASEDLWKRKYEEEQFGNAERSEGVKKWKERFKISWGIRKRMKTACARVPSRPFYQQERRQFFPPRVPGGRNFFPPRLPTIIGDPDILPRPFGSDFLARRGQQGGAFPRHRNTMPHCNLED